MPGTVTVGCKIPNGLLIHVDRMEDVIEQLPENRTRIVKRAVPATERVKLNGPARYVGFDANHTIVAGAGLTFGVDADLFAGWLAQNADSDAVRKKLVFAHAKSESTEAEARNMKLVKTGLEGLDRNNLPAEFKNKITTADVRS